MLISVQPICTCARESLGPQGEAMTTTHTPRSDVQIGEMPEGSAR